MTSWVLASSSCTTRPKAPLQTGHAITSSRILFINDYLAVGNLKLARRALSEYIVGQFDCQFGIR